MRKPCSPSCADGSSVVELLVAATVMLALAAGVLAVALSSRRLYEADHARTRLQQSMRTSRDFLVTDLRQAGERLDGSFPAITVVRGEDLPGGVAGDPDELILRRNLLDTVLRVCEDVDSAGDDVTIAVKIAPPIGCAPLPIDPGDVWPSNLQEWSDRRTAQGGVVRAYLYNPVTRVGEFFDYASEQEDADGYDLQKDPSSPPWQFAYPSADQCRVYLLEERRYRLSGDLLQVVVDAQDTLSLVDEVVDFQLLAHLKPTPAVPFPAPLDAFDGPDWTDLQTIEVMLGGRAALHTRILTDGWSARILPRNTL
jgi:type IV pilus assembly protein PilW